MSCQNPGRRFLHGVWGCLWRSGAKGTMHDRSGYGVTQPADATPAGRMGSMGVLHVAFWGLQGAGAGQGGPGVHELEISKMAKVNQLLHSQHGHPRLERASGDLCRATSFPTPTCKIVHNGPGKAFFAGPVWTPFSKSSGHLCGC